MPVGRVTRAWHYRSELRKPPRERKPSSSFNSEKNAREALAQGGPDGLAATAAAAAAAAGQDTQQHFYVVFVGIDHPPRTRKWEI